MRDTAYTLFLITTILTGLFIIPLIWLLPMLSNYKKAKTDGLPHTALAVCSIIFTGIFGIIAGIMLLVDKEGNK